jgi:hypothetical protein
MALPGNARSVAEAAPHGLVLVQELLNTGASGAGASVRPDLLLDVTDARRWADAVGAELGLDVRPVTATVVADLVRVREAVRDAIRRRDEPHREPGETVAAELELELDPHGVVAPASSGGVAGIPGLVLAEVLRAQARGDWQRLKICAFGYCATAFWDRSRNISARYHLPFCANYVNQHNSRNRRRTTTSPGTPAPPD